MIVPVPHDRRKNVCPACQMRYAKSVFKTVGRWANRKRVVVGYSCTQCGFVESGVIPVGQRKIKSDAR
jgi:hypothetical protein